MEYIKKDITTLEGPFIIIHGVNCLRTMGSGVAKAIYERWPIVKENYLAYGSMILGDIQPVGVGPMQWVVNCFTQEKYGTNGVVYADLAAIELCLLSSMAFAKILGFHTLYSPKIGCLRGGLDWDTQVEPIYCEIESRHSFVKINICDIN